MILRLIGWGGMLALFGIAGCSCGSPTPTTPCDTNTDCASGEVCVMDVCQPDTQDGGPVDSGPCIDSDKDGFCAGRDDCDDSDPLKGGEELCDDIDNDCDGEVDEGYKDICFNCVRACSVTSTPGPGGFMPDSSNSSNVLVDNDGALTITGERTQVVALWVANTDEGTVSKLDSATGAELARYPSSLLSTVADNQLLPSRTAVDQDFDAYVANRAKGTQSSVTKIEGDPADCEDRSGNGAFETSSTIDHAQVNINPPAGGYVGKDDDCVLWTEEVGGTDGVARALAIGTPAADEEAGDVWVGLHGDQQVCRLDYGTGAHNPANDCFDTGTDGSDPFRPYGAGADYDRGRVYFVDRKSAEGYESGEAQGRVVLGYLDEASLDFVKIKQGPDICGGNLNAYGMTVDLDGNVYVVLSCGKVLRYDPAGDSWSDYDLDGGNPRGIAVDTDNLWISMSNANGSWGGSNVWSQVYELPLNDLSTTTTKHDVLCNAPVGVGVSFDGSVWAVCQNSDQASRLDPDLTTWQPHPVGDTPYTYSDFIGYGANQGRPPQGEYRYEVTGCDGGFNSWQGARYQADIPAGTSVELYARVTNDLDTIDGLPWVGPFVGTETELGSGQYVVSFLESPGPLGSSRHLQVEVRLNTDSASVSPRFYGLDIAGLCIPDPI